MNLQSLRTFAIAGKKESLKAAADELLYAQSTVTTQIKQLEAEWGVELFRKEGRGVRLTPAGRAIHNKVQTLIEQVETIGLIVDGIASGGAGHIRIGVMEPAGSHLVAPILADFIRDRPLLQLNMETGSIYSLRERLLGHELEIVVSHQMRAAPKHGLSHFQPLFVEKQRLLVSKQHPFATKDVIELDDLRSERLMFQDTVAGYSGIDLNGLSFHGGSHPNANIELNSADALITFVRQGIGVAFLPSYCLESVPDDCVVRCVEGYDFSRTMGLYISTQTRDPVVLELVVALRRRLLDI